MSKTFDQRLQIVKDAFKALGVMTDKIDAVGGMSESHLPTRENAILKLMMWVVLYFAFLVSKFKGAFQKFNSSMQTFNSSIQTFISSI